jgi:pyrroloquinoline-quinone synthase
LTKCPACLTPQGPDDIPALAAHLISRADESEPAHVRWLNQNVTRQKTDESTVTLRLREFYDLGGSTIKGWVKREFIRRFYGPVPHPFVVALQHPTRAVLLGYEVEHQHFLRQWVRSCAYIMARTDQPKVVLYELDNLTTEFGGQGPAHPSHYELLLRMGESLGVDRAQVVSTNPLPATRRAIEEWDRIASREPWVEGLVAMHSLELIANRNLVEEGATTRYFDPRILHGDEITNPAKAFLREGYEADVMHSDEALELVTEFAGDGVDDVQSTFLRSIDLFDDYLLARLERADDFEN